jgi:hypothetical protein
LDRLPLAFLVMIIITINIIIIITTTTTTHRNAAGDGPAIARLGKGVHGGAKGPRRRLQELPQLVHLTTTDLGIRPGSSSSGVIIDDDGDDDDDDDDDDDKNNEDGDDDDDDDSSLISSLRGRVGVCRNFQST